MTASPHPDVGRRRAAPLSVPGVPSPPPRRAPASSSPHAALIAAHRRAAAHFEALSRYQWSRRCAHHRRSRHDDRPGNHHANTDPDTRVERGAPIAGRRQGAQRCQCRNGRDGALSGDALALLRGFTIARRLIRRCQGNTGPSQPDRSNCRNNKNPHGISPSRMIARHRPLPDGSQKPPANRTVPRDRDRGAIDLLRVWSAPVPSAANAGHRSHPWIRGVPQVRWIGQAAAA